MGRAKAVELTSSEEIVMRRIAAGIVRPRDWRRIDVERLISLGLVETERNALALTAHGGRLVADLPRGRLDSLSLDDDPHVAAVAKALGVKL